MNILKSDIISSQNDEYWADISPLIGKALPRPVLALTIDSGKNPQEESQLQKMLEACKLSPEQYNIVKLPAGRKVAWHQLRDRLDPKIVFLIGVLPVQLGVSASLRFNLPNRFNDCIWLPTLSVTELDKFQDVKKQLWLEGMKPVFVDKRFGGF